MVTSTGQPNYEQGQVVLLSDNATGSMVFSDSKDFKGNLAGFVMEVFNGKEGKYLFNSPKYKIYVFDSNQEILLFEEFVLPMPTAEASKYRQKAAQLLRELKPSD